MLDNYLIDYSSWFDEGGYCQVYPIKDHPSLVFKEFRNKKKASEALRYQKQLSKFNFAPKVYTKVCQLNFAPEEGLIYNEPSDWGYVAEIAKTSDSILETVSLQQIQKLVDDIEEKTGLKFWDCHKYNIGVVQRNNEDILVCIDTGKESFEGYSNAWGYDTPGPKCGYCSQYQCRCGVS